MTKTKLFFSWVLIGAVGLGITNACSSDPTPSSQSTVTVNITDTSTVSARLIIVPKDYDITVVRDSVNGVSCYQSQRGLSCIKTTP